MIIRTKTNVNIRKSPNTGSEILGVLMSGRQITVEGFVDNGQSINGNSRWYVDRLKNYYWSGGFDLGPPQPVVQLNDLSTHWWFTQYGINKIWAHTRGKEANVVIIDSGIDTKHPDLVDAVVSRANFIPGADKNDVKDEDQVSHGTRCAGIIAGRGSSQAIGVAPACRLHVAKVMPNINSIEIQPIIDALEWASKVVKADIISISAELFDDDPGLRSKINEIGAGERVIVCCAVGNGGLPEPVVRYPASYPACLAVGAIDSASELLNISNKNEFIDIVSPGGGIISTARNGGKITATDTSIATAYTAGVLALLVAYSKKTNVPLSRIQKMITATAADRGDAAWDVSYGHGIIDPVKAFSQTFNISL